MFFFVWFGFFGWLIFYQDSLQSPEKSLDQKKKKFTDRAKRKIIQVYYSKILTHKTSRNWLVKLGAEASITDWGRGT